MNSDGQFIEVQGTAEEAPFSMDEMQQMLALAQQGIGELIAHQQESLA